MLALRNIPRTGGRQQKRATFTVNRDRLTIHNRRNEYDHDQPDYAQFHHSRPR